MKVVYKILSVIFILNTLYACEKELKIKSPAIQPKIVLNGVISADSLICIYASKSYSYFEEGSKAGILSGASLKLYINNRFIEDMQVGEMNKRTVFKSTVRPKIGDNIRIEASAPGLEPAWTETKIPEAAFIGKVDTTTFFTPYRLTPIEYIDDNSISLPNFPEIKTESQYRNMRIGVEVKSPSGKEERFYQISLYSASFQDGKTHLRSLYIYTQGDPIFADSPRSKIFDELFSIKKNTQRYPIFSTRLFKNNAYTLQISTTNHYAPDIKVEKDENGTFYYSEKSSVLNPPIEIRVLSISPDLYLYYKSNDPGYFDGEFISLKEPLLTYSNVHNGIGIVGAVATAQKQIILPVFPGEKNVFPK